MIRTSPGLAGVSVLLLLALSPGCRSKPAEPSPQPGLPQQATDAAADTQALHEAVGAANEAVRNAGDCEAARAAVAAARETFEQVEPRLRTGAAHTSLAALRKQVDHVAELCP